MGMDQPQETGAVEFSDLYIGKGIELSLIDGIETAQGQGRIFRITRSNLSSCQQIEFMEFSGEGLCLPNVALILAQKGQYIFQKWCFRTMIIK